MKTVPLGRSGPAVSIACLGTMYYGTTVDEETSRRLLDQYLEAGGRFLDTANIYAAWAPSGRGGDSEELLGRWLADRGSRGELFIATKVGFAYGDVPVSLRADHIEAECEKSLRRMGIDAVDLYYAHLDERGTPLAEALGAFDRLVKAGKVRHVGASNYRAWRLAEALDLARAEGLAAYCCIQQRFTYVRPRWGAAFGRQVAANDDLLDFCRERDVRLLAYSPLLKGVYVRDDRPMPAPYVGGDTDARLAALRQVAAEKGATPNQVVLAWMMHSRPAVIPVFSASTAGQMTEDLGALDVALSEADMAALDSAGAG